MKLKLEKQKLVSLSSEEMNNVVGGGQARSQRRTGDCAYSRSNTSWHWEDIDNDGCYEQVVDGCLDPCPTWGIASGGDGPMDGADAQTDAGHV